MRPLDWLLIACAACLVAVGPAMALQEFAKAQDADAERVLHGTVPPVDPSFRAVWRIPLTVLVLIVGVAGTLVTVRALGDAVLRAVTKRLVALLVGGLALLDVTYYLDSYVFAAAPYALRGSTIVWAYPVVGVLVAGSIHRLAEVRAYFASEKGGAFRL